MIRIEAAIRGVDGEQGRRLVDAMTIGLKEQCGATRWSLSVSTIDEHGRDQGFRKYDNEGIRL